VRDRRAAEAGHIALRRALRRIPSAGDSIAVFTDIGSSRADGPVATSSGVYVGVIVA
jgi:hypothetical protein